MEKYCFTVITDEITDHQTHRVVKVVEGQSGYYPLGKANPDDPHELDKFSGSYPDMKGICDFMNNNLKLSEDDIEHIIHTSIQRQLDEDDYIESEDPHIPQDDDGEYSFRDHEDETVGPRTGYE